MNFLKGISLLLTRYAKKLQQATVTQVPATALEAEIKIAVKIVFCDNNAPYVLRVGSTGSRNIP